MSEEVRPFEEYKEMIKNMRKEEMIRGLYDLSARVTKQENIIKEIRKYIMSELITEWDIKNGGCVSGSDLPAYAIIPILEILDKENKK